MAEELGRNKSIISREINRHCEEKWDYNTGICKKVYSAAVAQGKYEYSKKKAGRKCKLSRALKQFIEDKILKEKWSPEEVAGYIKVNNIKFEIQPSFQIIYYWIEKGKLNISPLDLVHKAKLEKKEKKEEKTPMYRVSTKIRSKYRSVMALESSGFRRVSIQTTPFHRARRHGFSASHLGKAGWGTRCTRRSGRRSLCACGWTFPRNTQPPPARPAATR